MINSTDDDYDGSGDKKYIYMARIRQGRKCAVSRQYQTETI